MPELSQRLQEALASRYRIERELGWGGMAAVFLAEDLKHHRRVAIKVLDPQVAAEIGPARFLREIETAARLSHPHILPLFDSGNAEGLLYYVMPHVVGRSLRQRLEREKQLPVDEAVRITREVADALDYAHRSGIVHRDIKPENILLEAGHALVADFGIARIRAVSEPDAMASSQTASTLTTAATTVGTPAYMSPEQAGGNRDLDGRSDQYALACVLYEMLAGQPPFTGPTTESLVRQHLATPPRPITEVRAAVPAAVTRAIARALAKTPADRYTTVAQFADALAETAVDRTPRALVAPQRHRRKILPLVAATLGIGVLLALAFAWIPGALRGRGFPGQKPPRIESLAVMPLENLSRDPEQEYFVDGMTAALIAELYRLPELKKVVSPQSVMSYKGTRKTTGQIAAELKVDALIEGSSLRVGDSVRVTVHLIHGATDAQLWADTFDRDCRNILTLYSDIARAIAEGIQIKLDPANLPHHRAVDPIAYQLYLKGQDSWNKSTFEGLQNGIAYFRQAIDRDPSFALAHSGLSASYSFLGVNYLPPGEVFPLARTAAFDALALDSTIAETHLSMAAVQIFYDWDWARAWHHLDRALAFSPNNALVHNLRAYCRELTGRSDEAMAEVRRAQELDPLSVLLNVDVGIRHYYARRYDQAINQYQRVYEIDRNPALVSYWLWLACEQQGDYGKALDEFRHLARGPIAPEPGASRESPLGRAGYEAALREQLPKLEALRDRRPISAADIAAIHAFLGETGLAFDWLEKAYLDRESKLPWIKLDPRFDSLRADARFLGLLRRMNLHP